MEDTSILTRTAPPPTEVHRYGPEPDQVIDVYRPAGPVPAGDLVTSAGAVGSPPPGRPVLVLLHGGFWRPAFDRAHLRPMAWALAGFGWTVLCPEYRRIPGQPDASTDDVRLALAALPELIRAGGTTSPGSGSGSGSDSGSGPAEPVGVVLAGHSAGGQLALWAAATVAPENLRGVMALAPVADLREAHRRSLSRGAVSAFLGTTPAQRPDLDPARLGPPPVEVVLVHGERDPNVPIAVTESYLRAIAGAETAAVRVVRVPEAGHFGLIDPRSSAWPAVVAALRGFDPPS